MRRDEAAQRAACGRGAELAGMGGILIMRAGRVLGYVLCQQCRVEFTCDRRAVLDAVERRLAEV
jgi:hypothetical protein